MSDDESATTENNILSVVVEEKSFSIDWQVRAVYGKHHIKAAHISVDY
jgi:hypothetical protein